MARIRKQISLSIDPDVWKRCQRLKEQGGVNWSEVAEQAFVTVLDLVDRAVAIKAATGSMDEVVGDLERVAKSTYHKSLADLHQILPESVQPEIHEKSMELSKK